MKLNTLLMMFITLLVSGCASMYQPSQSVLEMSHKMTKQEAAKVFSNLFANPHKVEGVCKGNGIGESLSILSDSNMWELNEKSPEVKLTTSSITFNAEQIVRTYSSSGNIATQGAAGLVTTTKSSNIPFRKTIKFTDLKTITLKADTGMMTRRCYRPDGHTEVIVDLNQGFGFWFALVLKNEDVERFVAAIMVLSPETSIQTG